jgi:hypothetical protein
VHAVDSGILRAGPGKRCKVNVLNRGSSFWASALPTGEKLSRFLSNDSEDHRRRSRQLRSFLPDFPAKCMGRNPATGEQIKIPARTRLRFTPAKGPEGFSARRALDKAYQRNVFSTFRVLLQILIRPISSADSSSRVRS